MGRAGDLVLGWAAGGAWGAGSQLVLLPRENAAGVTGLAPAVKIRGSGVKRCQGEGVRRVTLTVILAGRWDNFPGGSGGTVIEGGA